MRLAPIALFVYNRPSHARRTVEALRNNELARESDLFVFSDAPKNPEAVAKVAEVREYVKAIEGFKSVTVVERDVNFGLARSIIDGVTRIVHEHGRIIVLEDDLIVTPHFLEFMNQGLKRYENDHQVMQVSGYMFPINISVTEDALFLPLTTSWGWATWELAWQHFDPEAKGYALLKSDSVLRKRFNLGGAYDYFSMLEAQLAGRIDSWAVRWQLSAFLKDALVLYPRHSLIVNAGIDGSGTHGKVVGELAQSGVVDTFCPEHFPSEIKASDAWDEVCSMVKRRVSVLNKIKMKLRSFLPQTDIVRGWKQ